MQEGFSDSHPSEQVRGTQREDQAKQVEAVPAVVTPEVGSVPGDVGAVAHPSDLCVPVGTADPAVHDDWFPEAAAKLVELFNKRRVR